MKKSIVSVISLVSAFGIIAPAFAYMPSSGFVRPSNRMQVEAIKSMRDVRKPTRRYIRDNRDRPILLERTVRNRGTSVTTATQDTYLERTTRAYEGRRNRRRVPKLGTDRYRALRPNTRYYRRMLEGSSLPPALIQTGASGAYDRPTRRDIRGGSGYFYNVNGRDRNLLEEMKNN